MNANTPLDASPELSSSYCTADLSIALVSPNEKRRAAAAESACNFCEFSSYLANPADQARMSQLQYDVIMVDIDDDTENSLKLVEKLCSAGNSRVLVYSSDTSPEKLARCMRAGARDFLAFPFEPAAVTAALNRFSSPPTATAHREAPAPRKCATNRDSMWRYVFNDSPMARSQARP
jgi:pilus assembly protein CpaE